MGQYAIKMPDIGEGIAEVELVAWRVQPGDNVTEDQILADVMTDKATVEIPSPVHGKVLALGGKVGELMAVGSELIRLEVEGAGNVKHGAPPAARSAAPAASAPAPAASSEPVAAKTQPPSSPPVTPEGGSSTAPVLAPTTASKGAPATQADIAPPPRMPQAPSRAPGDKPIASPAVRRRAWELGIELQYVHGSGPAGRITNEDLDVYLASRGQPMQAGRASTAYAERHEEEAIPVIGLRRKIAQKMQDAKRRIPHFSYVEEIDVTELEALRQKLNARYASVRGKLTLLPLIARAVVLAVRDFPQMNARFDDDAGVVTRYGAVHLGIATQTPSGLMVPVLQHAEAKDLWAIGAEVVRLAEAARSGKASRDELSGSTITITSLGPLGGIVTTPVINHPEVAIVGVNRIVERPMFRNGHVEARQLMNLSSSFDHRVVDGMDAAEFIQAIRAMLEAPAMLFVE
jgi:2-oxoisovalerate dehydrogenase E2 component (dihydrolipoyl transacylase)